MKNQVNEKSIYIKIKITIFCLILFCLCFYFIFNLFPKPTNKKIFRNAMTFETAGAAFSPVLTVVGNPKILWIFDDGTISTSKSPHKDYGLFYGLSRKRVNTLFVTPWDDLVGINVGYDGSDGGPGNIDRIKQQKVTAVYGLKNVAPYLKIWASSYSSLKYLDFNNFTNLTDIECFECRNLKTVNLNNTPLLSRVCFEANTLKELDLSHSPNISDIRGAQNKFRNIKFGFVGNKIWHLCIHDNDLEQNIPISQFTSIRELWIWNDKQTGILSPRSNQLKSVLAYGNNLNIANFDGCFAKGIKGEIDVSNNLISWISIKNCPGLLTLKARHNNLNNYAVDSILKSFNSFGTYNGYIDLSFNQGPSNEGQKYLNSLKAKGWKIIVNKELLLDDFVE